MKIILNFTLALFLTLSSRSYSLEFEPLFIPIENRIEVPNFDIEVRLTPSAEILLERKGEDFTITTIYFGFPKDEYQSKAGTDGKIYLNTIRVEKYYSGSHSLTNQFVNREKASWVNDQDYVLNIGVGSTKRNTQFNLLNCEAVENKISEIRAKNIVIECEPL